MSNLHRTFRIGFVCLDPEVDLIAFSRVVNAIDRQLREHVNPVWSVDASAHVLEPDNMRNVECVAHVQHRCDVARALAYHTVVRSQHLPLIVVGLDVCEKAGVSWSSAASHEAVEAAVNPLLYGAEAARLREPGAPSYPVSIDLEVCDPVQGTTYLLDDVEVSNFVLPQWFHPHAKGRVDLRGELVHPLTLARGGYVAFSDPRTGERREIFADQRATAVRTAKVTHGVTRRRVNDLRLVSLLTHILSFAKLLGQDLRRDPDGKVRLTLEEAVGLLTAAGCIVVDVATPDFRGLVPSGPAPLYSVAELVRVRDEPELVRRVTAWQWAPQGGFYRYTLEGLNGWWGENLLARDVSPEVLRDVSPPAQRDPWQDGDVSRPPGIDG